MIVLWTFLAVLLLAAAFCAGVFYGHRYLAAALAEERKCSNALRAGLNFLKTDRAEATRRIREYAAKVELDVKKIAPWLMFVLALGLASCDGNYAYARPACAGNNAIAGGVLDRIVHDCLTVGCPCPEAEGDGAASAHYWRDGEAALPDPDATPGAIDPELTTAKLCDPSFHTGTARNVTESRKKRICLAYGISDGCPGPGYEIDHLVSIELGGSNDDANLWPQPVDAKGLIGFHAKDVVENRAHRAVCEGTLTLAQAQAEIRKDWYAFGLRRGYLVLPGR